MLQTDFCNVCRRAYKNLSVEKGALMLEGVNQP